MKYNFYLCSLLVVLLVACRQKSGETEAQRLREENFRLKQENDSLKRSATSTDATSRDTIALMDQAKKLEPPTNLAGRHILSLHWINSQYPGFATIRPAKDGWFFITGLQVDGRDTSNYLKINGRIRKITPRELLFEGTIESQSDQVNEGKPCIRKGKNSFRAIGREPFWRMQDMINCEGGNATDFIDIYF